MKVPKNIIIRTVNTHDEIEIGLKPKIFQKKQKSTYVSTLFHNHSSHSSSSSHSKTSKSTLNTGVKQNCSVIAKYRNDKAGHLKNLEYIRKEGKGRDGEEPELYGSEENEEMYKNQAADKNWRIILSPQSNNIDLTALTKTFIEKLEEETGYKFTWVAANHYDTDNFHTHILINGIDKNGKEVRFLPRNKVSNLMRMYAQNICTDMIGYRSQNEIEKDYEKMTTKNYFTKLDRTLEEYCDEYGIVSRKYLDSKRQINLTDRLIYLEKIGLAQYMKTQGTYHLKKEWKDELKLLGKYNTFYDGRKYSGVSADKYSLYENKGNESIEGEIRKIYTMQKDSNNFAVVLKTKDGRGLYVPLNFYPEGCRTGDFVKITNNGKKTYINNFNRKK